MVFAMIESPFAEYVGFDIKTMDTLGDFSLSPEEAELLSPKAVQKRKDEFTLGRAASYYALKKVGFVSPPPVLKGKNREPIWPEGYIGTISHSSGVAISAVCSEAHAAGIGVDIEKLERNVSPGVFRITCTETELELVNSDHSKNQIMFKRIFSAKEAGFKAFYYHAKEYIDYKEATLSWDADKSCFKGILLKAAGKDYPVGTSFYVGSKLVAGFVFSFILLPKKYF